MQPYRVTKVYGVTYNFRQKLLPIHIDGIHTMPIRKLEEMIFKAIQTPQDEDPIVKLRIITKTI